MKDTWRSYWHFLGMNKVEEDVLELAENNLEEGGKKIIMSNFRLFSDLPPDGRIFLIFDQSRIVEYSDEPSLARERFQEAFVIYIKRERAGGSIEVGAINKNADTFFRIKHDHG